MIGFYEAVFFILHNRISHLCTSEFQVHIYTRYYTSFNEPTLCTFHLITDYDYFFIANANFFVAKLFCADSVMLYIVRFAFDFADTSTCDK